MVTINNVSFKYNDSEVILKDANLSIDSNKITIILGRNGIGKTTLLSLIDGFLSCDEGDIIKEEESAYIYDTPQLYEYLTGNEYLELLKRLQQDDIRFDINPLLKALRLEENMDKEISAFSLGMKHKLALISAIMLQYKIYLIDEPLAALDPESQKLMMSFFKQMKKDKNTLIISTHMLTVAYELGDDFIIFKNNKLEKHQNNFSSFSEFEQFILESLKVEI